MSDTKLSRQQVRFYETGEPFYIYNIRRELPHNGELLNPHWHKEIEIVYVFAGEAEHYIDGERIISQPGRLISINSECVHSIIPDYDAYERNPVATVLLIPPDFVQNQFHIKKQLFFHNEKTDTPPEIRDIMVKISEYADGDSHGEMDYLYIKGLVLQLLYHMFQRKILSEKPAENRSVRHEVEWLKEVIWYIEANYKEPISQAGTAESFHFSKEHFARVFKKYTGGTFLEYITAYRLHSAWQELVSTDKSVLEIALNNGFPNENQFIHSFKKKYGRTPLQYRKAVVEGEITVTAGHIKILPLGR